MTHNQHNQPMNNDDLSMHHIITCCSGHESAYICPLISCACKHNLGADDTRTTHTHKISTHRSRANLDRMSRLGLLHVRRQNFRVGVEQKPGRSGQPGGPQQEVVHSRVKNPRAGRPRATYSGAEISVSSLLQSPSTACRVRTAGGHPEPASPSATAAKSMPATCTGHLLTAAPPNNDPKTAPAVSSVCISCTTERRGGFCVLCPQCLVCGRCPMTLLVSMLRCGSAMEMERFDGVAMKMCKRWEQTVHRHPFCWEQLALTQPSLLDSVSQQWRGEQLPPVERVWLTTPFGSAQNILSDNKPFNNHPASAASNWRDADAHRHIEIRHARQRPSPSFLEQAAATRCVPHLRSITFVQKPVYSFLPTSVASASTSLTFTPSKNSDMTDE